MGEKPSQEGGEGGAGAPSSKVSFSVTLPKLNHTKLGGGVVSVVTGMGHRTRPKCKRQAEYMAEGVQRGGGEQGDQAGRRCHGDEKACLNYIHRHAGHLEGGGSGGMGKYGRLYGRPWASSQ